MSVEKINQGFLDNIEQGLGSDFNTEYLSFNKKETGIIKKVSLQIADHVFKDIRKFQKEHILKNPKNYSGKIMFNIIGPLPQTEDEIDIAQTAIQSTALDLLTNKKNEQVVFVNPIKGTETRYLKIAHGHCGCVIGEFRKTGEPWPSDIENTSKCEGAQN